METDAQVRVINRIDFLNPIIQDIYILMYFWNRFLAYPFGYNAFMIYQVFYNII